MDSRIIKTERPRVGNLREISQGLELFCRLVPKVVKMILLSMILPYSHSVFWLRLFRARYSVVRILLSLIEYKMHIIDLAIN